MLVIYQSNNLNTLKVLMESVIERERLDNPFESEIMLVESTGMAQWLQMSLAQKFGIAANIRFLSPANFIWEMFVHTIPGISQQNAFSSQNISWKLMTLLPEMLPRKEFILVKHYLNNDPDKRKLFQLATRTADLYVKYLIYRPSWLTTWESGSLITGLPEAQIWQAALWSALINLNKKLGQPQQYHLANLYDCFATVLKSTFGPIPWLPSRIFICGISALPTVYLNALKTLSRSIDIYILFTNPCRYYWGNIQDGCQLTQQMAKRRMLFLKKDTVVPVQNEDKTVQTFNEELFQIPPNPLLASWGKLGCDYVYMLSNIFSLEKSVVNAFSEIVPDSLLHNVQLDILNLENKAVTNTNFTHPVRSNMKRRLDPTDYSLTVHICHSQQREVEVLYDRLLALLQNDPNLTPRDIIVMVADIDSYSPFIQAVFGGAIGDRYIPYAISDCRMCQFHSIIPAFINLLSLPDSRFVSEDVLAFLDIPMLAARFNFKKDDLKYLRQWINESGIRWGLDDNNVQEFGLPATGQHTWKFGLTRMLLGYAMESSVGEWKEILPYDKSSGLIAELIGHLASLLMQLTKWRCTLKQSRTLEAWMPICQKILNDFFLLDSETDTAITLIKQHWTNIISEGIASNYNETISLSVIRDELIRRLDRERIKESFLTGPVNICALMPMRSIPFKVVCLLGMNDGVYPRILAPVSFDLMIQQPKRGDRSQRDDDRYTFLEALISAQEILYISYIGRSIQDNSERLPSILIQELMDYIGQSHYLPGDEECNCDESEQHVKMHITFCHSRMPFDPVNYEHTEWQSYVHEWLPAAKKEGIAQTNFIRTLESLPIKTLLLEQLQNFWSHPIRAFFQQRLLVNFYSEENNIPNTEPFSLEGVSRYQLNQQLLDVLVKKGDTRNLFRRWRAAGQLPHDAFGKIFWEEQCQEMQAIATRVIEYRQTDKKMEINLNCNGIQLTGWLQCVQPNGLLRWRPTLLTVSQGLQLWLEHLVYSASGNKGNSLLFVRNNGKWHFPPMDAETAKYYLNMFIKGYLHGMNTPLLLLPESGGAWIKACYDAKNNSIIINENTLLKARSKFFQSYEGNSIKRGEGKDIWYQRLWRTLESSCYDSIIKEVQHYLLPLFKFNQS